MMTVFLLPPESEQLEYKREFNSSGEKKRLLRTVVAFANGKGGKIIIGVDDASRTVSGLPPETDLSRLTDAVTNSIADNCTPQVAYKIRVEILDEKPVVVLDVFPGAFTPYYLKELGPDQGTFIRTGATTRLADIYRLTELRFSGSRRTFDTTVVSGAPAVTPTRLKALCRALYAEARQNAETLTLPPPKAPTPAILQDWKLISSNNGDVLPHYGFELLEGTCRAVPGSTVRCGLFLGEDRTDIRDTKVFSGPLIEQYHQTVDWLTSKLEVRTIINNGERYDIPELPANAVRELVMNAICHRSYIAAKDSITVALFRDRLEITSPGGLPDGMTVEQAISGFTTYRNPALDNALAYTHLMEKWASGIPRAFRLMKQWGLPAPIITDAGFAVRTVLMRPNDVSWPSAAQISQILQKPINASVTVETKRHNPRNDTDGLLSYLKNAPTATLDEMAREFNLSKDQVRYRLAKLKKEGRLTRSGTKKGRWLVKL